MNRSSVSARPRTRPPEPATELLTGFLTAVVTALIILITAARLGLVEPSPLTWYIARSSGLALFLTAWLLVMTGLGVVTKLLERIVSRQVAYSLHTFLAPMMLGFLVLHLAGLALDSTVSIGIRELFVPFTSGIREPWTGLGVIAFELSFIVGITAWFRQHLPTTLWRRLHFLAFPAFAAGVVHGLGSGTDMANPVVRSIYLAATLSTVFVACYRLLTRVRKPGSGSGRQQARVAATHAAPKTVDP